VIKPKTTNNKFESRLLGFPPVEVRRAEYIQKVSVAHAADRPEPDPLSQYLVSELEVRGIFRDERGYGVFVKALPTGTMFFARNGTHVYNGEVMRIAAEDADSANPKVLFREITHMEDGNGKRTNQEHVVAKVPGGAAR